jgi:hypothetical protein
MSSLAFYLLEKTGSIFGTYSTRMNKKEQIALFGRYFGKGLLVISGEDETVQHIIKVCFGTDYDVTARIKWIELGV